MRNLATIRKKKGYTQIELANKAGIASNSLARYERGEMQPTIEVVKLLADNLGVTVDELLNGPRDGKIELVVSWNWEDYKKGEINMFDEKFLMVLGTDGRVGLQGAGTVTNKATLEEFLGRVREQLEIALDAQIRRGVVVQEA